MKVTLELPEELLPFLPGEEAEMAEIISAGLRARKERMSHETGDLYSMIVILSAFPTPDEVLALHASPAVVQRSEELSAKNRESGLSPEEKGEWEEIMRVEHLVRIAKAKALLKLQSDPQAA